MEKKESGMSGKVGGGKELESARPFEVMDREDENMIIAELKGHQLPEVYVYSYEEGGKSVSGLSVVGVNQIRRQMAIPTKQRKAEVIRVLGDPQIKENENEIYVVVKAGRYLFDKDGKEYLFDVTYGAKRQSKFFSGWKKTPNPFFFETAISKAERNAVRRLLDEPLAQALIDDCLKGKTHFKTLKEEGRDAIPQEKPVEAKKTSTENVDLKAMTESQFKEIVRLKALIDEKVNNPQEFFEALLEQVGIPKDTALDSLDRVQGDELEKLLKKQFPAERAKEKSSPALKKGEYLCVDCEEKIVRKGTNTYAYAMKNFKEPVCFDCGRKRLKK